MSKTKKIFVAGSGNSTAFKTLAKNISLLLYDKGYELIITIAKNNSENHENGTLDVEIIESVNTYISNKHGIQKDGSKKTEVDSELSNNLRWKVHYYEAESYNKFENPNLPGIDFYRKKFDGTRQIVLLNAIKDCDCILLLGGKISTDLVGQLAIMLSKPMIPLPWCNGSSEKIWEEYGSEFNLDDAAFIDNYEQDAMTGNEIFKAKFFRLINNTIKNNPFNKENLRDLNAAVWLLVFVLICFFGWYLIYTCGSFEINNQLRILYSFSSIPISVVMGTVLRHGSLGNKRRFLLDLTKSLVISFGLVLIYFYAGYLASGAIPKFEKDDYARVTINLSLIGLFSGFLLESAEKALGEKLESYLQKQTKIKK